MYSGRWTLEEKLEHINGLELKAGFLGLQSFCSNLSNVHIKMYLDNTCSVAYLNHQGGMRSLYCDNLATAFGNSLNSVIYGLLQPTLLVS